MRRGQDGQGKIFQIYQGPSYSFTVRASLCTEIKIAMIPCHSPKSCPPQWRRRADTAGTSGSGCSPPIQRARDLIRDYIYCTEVPKMVCMWLREICSCSCLPVLLSPAWVLLSKNYRPFFGSSVCAYCFFLWSTMSTPQHISNVIVKMCHESKIVLPTSHFGHSRLDLVQQLEVLFAHGPLVRQHLLAHFPEFGVVSPRHPAVEMNEFKFLRVLLSISLGRGWHIMFIQTSRCHQNKGCVLVHGPHTKTELLFWCQREGWATWCVTLSFSWLIDSF